MVAESASGQAIVEDTVEVILNNRAWGNVPEFARKPKTNVDEIV